ncbi:FAR1-related sequence 4 [Striga asiatica]|uniref:FAR1-related sequence 4 n=1 Tax=Striga asiatica TaxID=4170 RepID=A0A5A7Q623_STRAF|nr:FAR1-related sequence 4 [Striga asiatica]
MEFRKYKCMMIDLSQIHSWVHALAAIIHDPNCLAARLRSRATCRKPSLHQTQRVRLNNPNFLHQIFTITPNSTKSICRHLSHLRPKPLPQFYTPNFHNHRPIPKHTHFPRTRPHKNIVHNRNSRYSPLSPHMNPVKLLDFPHPHLKPRRLPHLIPNQRQSVLKQFPRRVSVKHLQTLVRVEIPFPHVIRFHI